MRLAEIEIEYNEEPKTEGILAAVNAAVVYGPPIELHEGKFMSWHKYLVDLDKFPPVKYKVHRFVNWSQEVENLDKPNDRPPMNNRCNVVVPGLGLLLMNRVKVCTDYCTEMLQDQLNDGWRILAICPQPDQRRPDYVLGKADKPGEY